MTRFKPLGERARWRVLYEDLLVPADHGDVFTYEQLAEALDLHPIKQRSAVRSAVMRAAEELLEVQGRALVVERDVGYRVAEPSTHMVMARRQQKRSSKALERGHALATRLDMSALDPTMRHALEIVGEAFALQMEFNRRFDVRQRRLEEAMDSTRLQQERTAEEVDRIRDRLRRVEEQLE